MLNNGAQTAANAGKPVIIRLGWEANNEGSYPWAATGDGSTWKTASSAGSTSSTRSHDDTRARSASSIVWNMANSGTITYPIDNLWPGNDYVDIVGSQYYDRCSPLPEGDRYAFEARIDARSYSNNPAGPRAWLEYAKAKGKPWAVPEWGIGGPRERCAEPGIDNPYFIRKMYEFFWNNAADIAFEAYFNDIGGADPGKAPTSCSRRPRQTDRRRRRLSRLCERYNPRSAAMYRTLGRRLGPGRAPAAGAARAAAAAACQRRALLAALHRQLRRPDHEHRAGRRPGLRQLGRQRPGAEAHRLLRPARPTSTATRLRRAVRRPT